MTNIVEVLGNAKRIGITGHIRPDGDCLGSCTALYTYLSENVKDIELFMFLERVPKDFNYLPNIDKIVTDYPLVEPLDLLICLDSSDLERIGNASKYFEQAKKTVCIDHHISNDNYVKELNYITNNYQTIILLVQRDLNSSIPWRTVSALDMSVMSEWT